MKPTTPSDFLFVGENLALDLVNTEIIKRRKQYDLLLASADVATWWAEVQVYYAPSEFVHGEVDLQYDAVLLQMVKALRANLRKLFSSLIEQQHIHDDDIAFLNQILQQSYPLFMWTDEGVPVQKYAYGDDHYAGLLLPIALAAVDLISTMDSERLHHCHNNHCILMFYDTSKSGTRQWCSTACMDRERSARRYREAQKKS